MTRGGEPRTFFPVFGSKSLKKMVPKVGHTECHTLCDKVLHSSKLLGSLGTKQLHHLRDAE